MNKLQTITDFQGNLKTVESELKKILPALGKARKDLEADEVDALLYGRAADPKLRKLVAGIEARETELLDKARVIGLSITRLREEEEAARGQVRYDLRQALLAQLQPYNANVLKAFQVAREQVEAWIRIVNAAEASAVKTTGRSLDLYDVGLATFLLPQDASDPRQDYYDRRNQEIGRTVDMLLFSTIIDGLVNRATNEQIRKRS